MLGCEKEAHTEKNRKNRGGDIVEGCVRNVCFGRVTPLFFFSFFAHFFFLAPQHPRTATKGESGASR